MGRGNLERKEKQSAAAKAGGPGGQKADPRSRPQPSENAKQKLTPVPLDMMTQPPQAPRKRTPHSVQDQHHFSRQNHPRPKEEQDHSWSLRHQLTAPKAASAVTSKAASSGRPDASWSWNCDHYSARREWSFWHGSWYYRDEAGGRWVYWNRR